MIHFTCLELPLLLQRIWPRKLNTFLKSTGSGEHFDVKIEILTILGSEIPKSVLKIGKQKSVRFCSFWYPTYPMVP